VHSGHPVATRSPRDWIQISVTALPGLAAVIALIFTSLSIRATDDQLQITAQGQITDRYNAAITNLGSPSVDVRLGGIYALQRMMQDSPRDQPTVVAVLCAFVRDHANAATVKPPPLPPFPHTRSGPSQVPTDIQAAITVVGTRNTAYDGSTTVVDFTNVDLSGMNLRGEPFFGANLAGANLAGADLFGANLINASLFDANLAYADLIHANLTGAYLFSADLTQAALFGAYLTDANLTGASLTGASLTGANLTGANLTDANLVYANLKFADLFGANLTNASLFEADLTGANLTSAKLSGATGLRVGPPRSPTGSTSTPSATKNLPRWTIVRVRGGVADDAARTQHHVLKVCPLR